MIRTGGSEQVVGELILADFDSDSDYGDDPLRLLVMLISALVAYERQEIE
jgi:hypothetical protein